MARTYGEGTYGEGFYGSGTPTDTEPTWQDVTPTAYSIQVVRGDEAARQSVSVSECTIEYIDADGDLYPFSPSLDVERPQVGTFTRVSIIDPQGEFEPLFVGRIEAITDTHDDSYRTVTVKCYGVESDLSTTLPAWTRPDYEHADDRLVAATTDAGWQWADWINTSDGWPDSPTPELRDIDAALAPVTALQAIDQTARSAGWTCDVTRDGRPRASYYPLDGTGGLPITVVDCKGDPDAVASPAITYALDAVETLNVVELRVPATTDQPVDITYTAEDADSIDKAGRRSQALGYPIADASTKLVDGQGIVDRVLARYKDTLARVYAVEANSLTDPRWLPHLPALDRNTPVLVRRDGLPENPLTIAGQVTGYVHRLDRSSWVSTIYTTTQSVTDDADPATQQAMLLEAAGQSADSLQAQPYGALGVE